MMEYAYRLSRDACKHCKAEHYYLSNNHIIVTGTIEELKRINFPLPIEVYDKQKCHIKKSMNIFKHYPELVKFYKS